MAFSPPLGGLGMRGSMVLTIIICISFFSLCERKNEIQKEDKVPLRKTDACPTAEVLSITNHLNTALDA
jgi:hypothetical protein